MSPFCARLVTRAWLLEPELRHAIVNDLEYRDVWDEEARCAKRVSFVRTDRVTSGTMKARRRSFVLNIREASFN